MADSGGPEYQEFVENVGFLCGELEIVHRREIFDPSHMFLGQSLFSGILLLS